MSFALKRPVLAFLMASLFAPMASAKDGDTGAYLAARIASMESDHRQAATWFTRALLSDPSNPALLEGATLAYLSTGQMENAAKVAKQLEQLGVNNQSAFLALLADQAKRGEFDAILADAKAGRKIGALLDGLVQSWAELGAGRMSEAQAGFDSIASDPGLEVFGAYHKALALASVGDFEGADGMMSGKAADAIRGMRRGVIAHAQILSQLERNPDAIGLLDLTYAPGQDPGIDALRARLQAGEPAPFDIALNATDGISEVFFSMATALNGEADDGYTLLYTRIASYLRADHTEALLLTAGLLVAQGQHDLAVETYAKVPEADPTFHVAEIGRAEALLAAGKKEASIEALQSLARSHATIIDVNRALGDSLRREERFADAVPAYDAAIALAEKTPTPQTWQIYYTRAISHERLKQWDKAEADFRKALQLQPDQPQVLNYLGYSYIDMNKNLDEALAMIERAVALEPDSGYILDSLAWGLFRLGRYTDAVAPMERASLLEPVDPIVTDHLGDVYWAVGRRLEAEFQWQRALSFGPDEKETTRIQRKLDVGLDAVLAEEGAKPITAKTAADAN